MRAARAFLAWRSGFVASPRSLQGGELRKEGLQVLIPGRRDDEHDRDLLER